jgi:predicted transcriptional regulator
LADEGRVVTAKLPEELAARLDKAGERIERSKSWIIRQAVAEWLAEEQRRDELTREALAQVDAGETFTHEEVLAMVEQRKRERREARTKNAA